MSNYNGIFVRSALGQDNAIPKQGYQNNSPDIMPMGTVPIANPQSLFENGYEVYFETPLAAAQTNYIYLRGKNYAAQPINDTGDTRPRLFSTRSSLLLWPQTWEELDTCPSSSDLALKADPQAVGVANRPFVWKPTAISNDHYCLISVVPSPDYDNNLPDQFSNYENFNQWVAAHGGIGWQSVALANPNGFVFSNQVSFQIGPYSGQVLFLISCKDIPLGCQVSFSAGSPGTSPAVYLPPVTVTSSPNFSAGVQCNVPADYISDIYYTLITPAGTTIPVGAYVDMKAYLVSNPDGLLKGSDHMTVIASNSFNF
ncbi:MAG TPA: hypothetical protein VIM55_13590 [Mucilaginibacter sp.]